MGGLRGLGVRAARAENEKAGRAGKAGSASRTGRDVGRVGQVRRVGQVEVRAAPAIEGRLGRVDVYSSLIVRLLFAYCSLFLYRSYIVCIG